MRDYSRSWKDYRNAVGCAVGSARLALPFYDGDQLASVVAAIEIAGLYVTDRKVDRGEAYEAAAYTAYAATDCSPTAADAAARAAGAAAHAADAAAKADWAAEKDDLADCAVALASHAVHEAADAGADDSEICTVYARWVVRDLSPRWPIDKQIRQAAGAAVVAGDEDLARELLQ